MTLVYRFTILIRGHTLCYCSIGRSTQRNVEIVNEIVVRKCREVTYVIYPVHFVFILPTCVHRTILVVYFPLGWQYNPTNLHVYYLRVGDNTFDLRYNPLLVYVLCKLTVNCSTYIIFFASLESQQICEVFIIW